MQIVPTERVCRKRNIVFRRRQMSPTKRNDETTKTKIWPQTVQTVRVVTVVRRNSSSPAKNVDFVD